MTDLVVVAAVVLVQVRVHVGRIVLTDAAEKLGMLMIMLKMMLALDDDDGGDCVRREILFVHWIIQCGGIGGISIRM
jgi:hypothetical protein